MMLSAHPLLARSQRIPNARLPSPFPPVPTDAWTAFVRAMATQATGTISPSNGLGLFEMKPRRLQDLGLMMDVVPLRRNGKCVWTGRFVSPLSPRRFLSDPVLQYNTFVASMTDYTGRIDRGDLVLPDGMSRAGALAILHRSGPAGLKGERFESTQRLFEQVREIF